VFELIDDVLLEAGIDQLVVTGTIEGLRRRAHWWGFDLVDVSPDGAGRVSALRCVVFARHMPPIEKALAADDATLADGAVATVTGRLGTNAAWGELRVVATTVTIEQARSAEIPPVTLSSTGWSPREWPPRNTVSACRPVPVVSASSPATAPPVPPTLTHSSPARATTGSWCAVPCPWQAAGRPTRSPKGSRHWLSAGRI
jgi:hypothetical protein